MISRASDRARVWAVVLAGGEGERLRPLVQRWLGCHRPKQYCTFTGTRSMFQHTVDRASRLVHPRRIVAVAAQAHRAELAQQLSGRPIGATLLQPDNRDTAAGIFLPLAYIKATDPDATVLILPSDHFVQPEERFARIARRMIAAADRWRDRLILLAVPPDRPEVEYGWIAPGRPLGASTILPVRAVSAFIEKPGAAEAASAMAGGGLWNTLVIAARLETLWELGWQCFADMMPLFDRVEQAARLGGDLNLEEIYARMPRWNFSSDLLSRVPERVAVVEADGLLWSDWGRPERILGTLTTIGRAPAFPPELVAGTGAALALPTPDQARALRAVPARRHAGAAAARRRAV